MRPLSLLILTSSSSIPHRAIPSEAGEGVGRRTRVRVHRSGERSSSARTWYLGYVPTRSIRF